MTLRLLSRSNGRYLMIFPGWAFDHRIFLEKKWDFDLIACDDSDPVSFEKETTEFIDREHPSPLFLLGWSMGGLLVSRLFRLPGFSDRIEKAFVMSLPPVFDARAIGKIRQALLQEGVESLKEFYRLAFRGNKMFYEQFKQKYEADLIGSIGREILLKQLDFLESERVPGTFFTHPKVRLFLSLKDPLVSAFPVLSLRPDIVTVPATHVPIWYDEVVNAVNKG